MPLTHCQAFSGYPYSQYSKEPEYSLVIKSKNMYQPSDVQTGNDQPAQHLRGKTLHRSCTPLCLENFNANKATRSVMPLLLVAVSIWILRDVHTWMPGSIIDPPVSTAPSVQIPIGLRSRYIVSGLTFNSTEKHHVCLDLESMEFHLLTGSSSSPFAVRDAFPPSQIW